MMCLSRLTPMRLQEGTQSHSVTQPTGIALSDNSYSCQHHSLIHRLNLQPNFAAPEAAKAMQQSSHPDAGAATERGNRKGNGRIVRLNHAHFLRASAPFAH